MTGCLTSGCDLMERLYGNQLWMYSADAFKMVRLMGKHAVDISDDLTVVSAFLSSPFPAGSAPMAGPELASFDWKNAPIRMLMTFHPLKNKHRIANAGSPQREPFARCLAVESPLARLGADG